ncbi:hypothetical protein A5844_001258, partial [Enterococcus sp. 10A9_DIV0425]
RFWIKPKITPPTIEPSKIDPTQATFPVTTGNTKKPPCGAGTCTPVSYTHLDVYKRHSRNNR